MRIFSLGFRQSATDEGMLQLAQDFPTPSVEVIEPREIKDFAMTAGYQVRCLTGSRLLLHTASGSDSQCTQGHTHTTCFRTWCIFPHPISAVHVHTLLTYIPLYIKARISVSDARYAAVFVCLHVRYKVYAGEET